MFCPPKLTELLRLWSQAGWNTHKMNSVVDGSQIQQAAYEFPGVRHARVFFSPAQLLRQQSLDEDKHQIQLYSDEIHTRSIFLLAGGGGQQRGQLW